MVSLPVSLGYAFSLPKNWSSVVVQLCQNGNEGYVWRIFACFCHWTLIWRADRLILLCVLVLIWKVAWIASFIIFYPTLNLHCGWEAIYIYTCIVTQASSTIRSIYFRLLFYYLFQCVRVVWTMYVIFCVTIMTRKSSIRNHLNKKSILRCSSNMSSILKLVCSAPIPLERACQKHFGNDECIILYMRVAWTTKINCKPWDVLRELGTLHIHKHTVNSSLVGESF